MQNFGGTNKEYYGIFHIGLCYNVIIRFMVICIHVSVPKGISQAKEFHALLFCGASF